MSTAPDMNEVGRAIRLLLPSPEYQVLLFGSRVSGWPRPMSDWDIAISGPSPLDGACRQKIRDVLDEWPTLHKFDLIDLGLVSEAFRKAVLDKGVMIA